MNNEEIQIWNEFMQLKFYDAIEDWKDLREVEEHYQREKIYTMFDDELDTLCPDMLDPVTYRYMKNPVYLECWHRFDKSTLQELVKTTSWNYISCPLCRRKHNTPLNIYMNIGALVRHHTEKLIPKESENRGSICQNENLYFRKIQKEFREVITNVDLFKALKDRRKFLESHKWPEPAILRDLKDLEANMIREQRTTISGKPLIITRSG
jgi:hypothetical protein